MKRITIIGKGNVATHLYKALTEKAQEEILVNIVNSRTLEGLPQYSDVIIISVKDDAIEEVAAKVAGKSGILVHTSGSTDIDILKGYSDNYGVFYPLQTFSKGKELIYKEIPFFVEGSSQGVLESLKSLASRISPKVYEADSDRRKLLHIAAVFACNFSNHLVGIADELLKDEGLSYEVLLPLLKETVSKLESLSPAEAQTGPAVRGDVSVLKAHEEMLADKPKQREIYRLISDSIMDESGKVR